MHQGCKGTPQCIPPAYPVRLVARLKGALLAQRGTPPRHRWTDMTAEGYPARSGCFPQVECVTSGLTACYWPIPLVKRRPAWPSIIGFSFTAPEQPDVKLCPVTASNLYKRAERSCCVCLGRCTSNAPEEHIYPGSHGQKHSSPESPSGRTGAPLHVPPPTEGQSGQRSREKALPERQRPHRARSAPYKPVLRSRWN